MIISIINQKGGVGKTTIAVNLAGELARQKKHTLIVDLDPQANASILLQVRNAQPSIYDSLRNVSRFPLHRTICPTKIANLDLAPGDQQMALIERKIRRRRGHPRELRLRNILEPLRKQYDAILIDNAPTLGLPALMALSAADIALIPVQCEELAVVGLSQVESTISEMRSPRFNPGLEPRILLTLLDHEDTEGHALADQIRLRRGKAVCNTVLHRHRELAHLMRRGGVIQQFAPESEATATFKKLAQEVYSINGKNSR